ncbi:hypothetical protein SAMN05216419_10536 [Nitrosomonas cryotolerans]|uniref:Uncharacterized protein n=1 Tax=Nitrosomonas cryotolerans ATCC 49181 TaxID=1131553 RepID=A0A1N6GAW0_9PROT|nr:hypothetical protein SAMN05216419_10536 [Nitrosomonas cryotolerans]SIO04689.1 hypothetical protein SAMN02743940_0629 [Nitrosomonas cryotolerans ATCC 49181]
MLELFLALMNILTIGLLSLNVFNHVLRNRKDIKLNFKLIENEG